MTTVMTYDDLMKMKEGAHYQQDRDLSLMFSLAHWLWLEHRVLVPEKWHIRNHLCSQSREFLLENDDNIRDYYQYVKDVKELIKFGNYLYECNKEYIDKGDHNMYPSYVWDECDDW